MSVLPAFYKYTGALRIDDNIQGGCDQIIRLAPVKTKATRYEVRGLVISAIDAIINAAEDEYQHEDAYGQLQDLAEIHGPDHIMTHVYVGFEAVCSEMEIGGYGDVAAFLQGSLYTLQNMRERYRREMVEMKDEATVAADLATDVFVPGASWGNVIPGGSVEDFGWTPSEDELRPEIDSEDDSSEAEAEDGESGGDDSEVTEDEDQDEDDGSRKMVLRSRVLTLTNQ